MRVLIFGSKSKLYQQADNFFGEYGFLVRLIDDGRDPLKCIESGDVVFLENHKDHGLQVIHKIREKNPNITLAASRPNNYADAIQLLDAGVDELVSPSGLEESLIRIRNAAIRRVVAAQHIAETKRAEMAIAIKRGIRISPDLRGVWVDGTPVRLTIKEFLIFLLLAENIGQPVTRAQIIDRLYPDDQGAPDLNSRVIDVFVCHVRRKMNFAGANVSIRPIRGYGYVMDPMDIVFGQSPEFNIEIAAFREPPRKQDISFAA